MKRRRSESAIKILACSDVRCWDRFRASLHAAKPHIVILAGDLVCDGHVTHDPDARVASGHVRKFYEAIQYAGQRSKVVVVKGNHDDCFPGDYAADRINTTLGCIEISGKLREVEGLRILGLSFEQTHRLRMLRSLLATFGGRADIVVAHCEQSRLRSVAQFRPQVVVRGHFGAGTFMVEGVPTVQPNEADCVHIEFERGLLRRIDETPKPRMALLQHQMRHWPWLQPYSTGQAPDDRPSSSKARVR